MTDFQHDCARDIPEQAEATTHDLSHSSQPTGSEPTFQPIATAPAKTADEALEILAQECNELADREEAMHTARGVFDTNSAAYAAAGKAIDPVTDLLQFKWTTAALVWPDTHAGLAAKARIYHSMRHALVGCVVEEAQPLLESIAADALRLGVGMPAQPDAELLALGARLERLWVEEEMVEGDDDVVDAALDRSRAVVDAIMALQPTTPAGIRVKARAVAWGFNGEIAEDHGTGSELLRQFLTDLGALDDIPVSKPAEPELPLPVMDGAAANRLALESYRTWLEREYRALNNEMYPGQPDVLNAVHLNNPGGRFHFRGEPPASSRADQILTALGIDWRNDPVAIADQQHERAA